MRISVIVENICILFCFSLSWMMFGLDSGCISEGYLNLSDLKHKQKDFDAYLNQGFNIGASIGSLAFFLLHIKKKKILFISGDAAIVCGSALLLFAKNTASISVGRGLLGIGMGIVCLSGPMAITENFAKKHQPWILSVGGVTLQLGLFTAFLISLFDVLKWKNFFVIEAVLAILQATFVLLAHKENEAVITLKEQLAEFLNKKTLRNSILPSILVQCCHFSAGYPMLMSQAQNFVKTDVLMIAALLASICSLFMIHFLKRRLLILSSMPIITIILGLLALTSPKPGSNWGKGLILIYIVTFTGVVANLPIVYALELFPEKLKGSGIGVIGILNWVSNILLSEAVDMKKVSVSGLWTCFFLSLFFVVMSSFFTSETKSSAPADTSETKSSAPADTEEDVA